MSCIKKYIDLDEQMQRKAKKPTNAQGKDLEVFVKVSFFELLAFAKNFDFSSNLRFPFKANNTLSTGTNSSM